MNHVIDARGNTTSYGYDTGNLNLTSVTHPPPRATAGLTAKARAGPGTNEASTLTKVTPAHAFSNGTR